MAGIKYLTWVSPIILIFSLLTLLFGTMSIIAALRLSLGESLVLGILALIAFLVAYSYGKNISEKT